MPAREVVSTWTCSPSVAASRASSVASATLQLAGIHHQLLRAGRRGAPCPPGQRDHAHQVPMPSEAVKERTLPIGGEEPLVLVLPMNLRDPPAERGECANGDRAVVDAC